MLADKVSLGTKILIPRAQEARAILSAKLAQMGAQVDSVPFYKTITSDQKLCEVQQQLKAGENDLIIGAENKQYLSKVVIACIGPVTAATCVENKLNPTIIAGKYTIEGLVEAITKHYNKDYKGVRKYHETVSKTTEIAAF